MSTITAIEKVSTGWQYSFTGNGSIHLIYENGILLNACSTSPFLYKTSATTPPSIEIVSLEDETRLSMLENVSAFCGTVLRVQWRTNDSPYYRIYIIDDDGEILQKTLIKSDGGLIYTHEYKFSSTQQVHYAITACNVTIDGYVYDKSDAPEITDICVYTPQKPVVEATVANGVISLS